MNNEELKRLQDCMDLLSASKTLQLATVDHKGCPHISYAPFVRQDAFFYIFVSQLASHTQHLQQIANSALKASLMIIRDEAQSKNIFARERIIIEVDTELIDRSDAERVLDEMETKLGGTVALLRQLPDFMLFRLSAVNARYIAGFGKAFHLDFQKMKLQHISAEKLTER